MRLGILDMLGTVGMLIFALPVAGYGIERALGGDAVVGGGFLVLAVLMVLLPQKLTTPSDVPGAVAERAVGGVVSTDDDEES
ncbi:hypothetical protein RYH80_10740 [Halobaculum sp. MBLA0147]|uniref:DUF7533 family protein n=1 Tax=Halobaculum sp. MBLA0147 TaxID=3079934 RepID=UPI0035258DE5